jgi:iron-sulfur cluster repair protein YtfE (RIC family)
VKGTQLPTLRQRAAGEPEPDLTRMVLVHRAIGADLGRLTASVDELAGNRGTPAPGRLRAIRQYAAALLTEIAGHLDNEEEIVWPVLAAAALQAVDLSPLTDDHRAIGATAGRVSQALGSPGELRGPLRELLDMLDEHMADEEQQVFPAMRRYLHAETYRWCEIQAQRAASLTRLRFAVPWLARHAHADELNRLLAAGGWRARILLEITRPGYTRLERLAFGAAGCRADNRGVAL